MSELDTIPYQNALIIEVGDENVEDFSAINFALTTLNQFARVSATARGCFVRRRVNDNYRLVEGWQLCVSNKLYAF